MLRNILNNRLSFWLILALPALPMLFGVASGRAEAGDLLHPSGETSARLMILAIAINPLITLFGHRGWLDWLAQRRRYLGVAAFGYAAIHLLFYVIDMGTLADMLAEALAPGIWTGWAALALFVPLAITSNDASMRALKAGWKRLQRLVYPAAVLTVLHWIFVHNNLGPALVHFVPLAMIVMARLYLSQTRKPQGA